MQKGKQGAASSDLLWIITFATASIYKYKNKKPPDFSGGLFSLY